MIYHIADKKEWEDSLSGKEYETGSLNAEGFIHCSPLEKVRESANNFFKGRNGLVVLCINESKVKSKVMYEDLYDTGFEFPHIYGKLNTDAVVKTVELKCDDDGFFNHIEI